MDDTHPLHEWDIENVLAEVLNDNISEIAAQQLAEWLIREGYFG